VKPIEELIALTTDENTSARRLGCDPEFVVQWRPRKHWQTGRIEPGWEPSAGFIAAALAILRTNA
jgi:hypothetical protein